MKFHKAFGTGALLLTRLSIQRRGPSGKLKTYLRKIAMGTGLRHRPPEIRRYMFVYRIFQRKRQQKSCSDAKLSELSPSYGSLWPYGLTHR